MKVWIMTILFLSDHLEQAADKLDRQMTDLALRLTGDTLECAQAITEMSDRKRRLVNLAVLHHRLKSALSQEEQALLTAAVSGRSIADAAKALQVSRATAFRRQRSAFRHAETMLKRLGFDAGRMVADYGSIALCRRAYVVCARRSRASEAALRKEEIEEWVRLSA